MSEEENLNLRGSIKDLRNVAKTLDAVNFNFRMNELEKFLDGIKVDKPAKPPEDVLKKLLEKYLRGVLSVYLLHYDGSDKTELLRQKLNSLRNVDSASLKKTFAARDKLFADERFTNMARLFANKLSVEGSLETIGLSNFYKASNFIQTALIIFFRSNVATLQNQFKILDELDADFDTYKNIFPAVADALIQSVARMGFDKKKCIEFFYRRLGDPRFGNGRFVWKEVSDKSRGIFLRWLVEDDLEIFFKIIKQTAVDSMWRYREKFWRACLS